MKKRFTFRLSLLTVSLLSAGIVCAADSSPFAMAPLNLQETATVKTVTVKVPQKTITTETQDITTTSTTAPGVKPNVMLLLDDSGSMTESVGGVTKINSLRRVMSRVINQNADKVTWGLNVFNNGGWNMAMGSDATKVRDAINLINPRGATPTTSRYIQAAERLDGAIKYRCQKNYLILMSDGDANGDRWESLNERLNRQTTLGDVWDRGKSFWRTVLGGQYGYENTSGEAYRLLSWSRNDNNGNFLQPVNNQFVYYPYAGNADEEMGYVNRCPNNPVPFPSSLPGYKGACYNKLKYGYNQTLHNRHHLYAYADEILRYLSRALDSQDLRKGGVDAAGKSWDDPVFPKQNITTFTIGFGGGVSEYGTRFLRGAATPGVTDGKGNPVASYFNASDGTALLHSMNAIFETIGSQNPPPVPGKPVETVVTSPDGRVQTDPKPSGLAMSVAQQVSYAVTAPGAIGGGNSKDIPNMAASIYLPAGLRSSELRFYTLVDGSPVKDPNNPTKYKYTLADFKERKALINTGKSIEWGDTGNSSVLNNTYFKLLPDEKGRNDEWNQALLPWVTRTSGKNDNDISAFNYPTPYRVRGSSERDMGDIMDTSVIAIGNLDNQKRQEFLITAANDGMVYLFKSTNDINTPYSLKLNYMPASLPRSSADETIATQLAHIADKDYVQDTKHPHLFLINGGIVARRTDDSRPQQVFIVGNTGQGARGMYAINVGGGKVDSSPGNAAALGLSNSDAAQWKNDVPLFEVAGGKGDAANLGYTVGTPQLARISTQYAGKKPIAGVAKNIRYAAFLSSGYAYPSKDEQETALYIFDALGKDVGTAQIGAAMNDSIPGKLLTKVIVPGGKGGLSSPTLIDMNRDGVADYAFAGDYGGNMYRFDLRTFPNPVVTKIYSGDAKQPITSAPAISKRDNNRFVVIFGTGSDIYDADFKGKDPQAVYGIYQRFDDDLNAVDLNDPSKAESESAQLPLQKQTLSADGTDYRKVTDNTVFSSGTTLAYRGWTVPLDSTNGERVTVKPDMVLGTVVLSTRIYTQRTVQATYPDWNEKDWEVGGWKLLAEDIKNKIESAWTAWKQIENNTSNDNGSNEKDPCLGNTTTNVKKEQRTRETNFDKVSIYEQIIPGKTESSGWILTLNAINGGALGAKDTGVDFKRSGSNPMTNGFYTAGMKLSGLPSMAILSETRTESSRTRDDDIGGTGKDEKLDPTKSGTGTRVAKKDPDCFGNEFNYILPSDTVSGIGSAFRLHGKACPDPNASSELRRLSWKEIF